MPQGRKPCYVIPSPALPEGTPRREWTDPLVLVATATAEFIFLTDTLEIEKRHVSNWNEPVRITAPHQQDVDTMLLQISKKIVDGLKEIDELEDEAIARLDQMLLDSTRK